MSRYRRKVPVVNDSDLYRKTLKDRGVKEITQYRTPNLRHPTVKERASLDRISHVWKTGDRFYKLAHKYYDDPKLWWVIAWFNQTPTESHVSLGQVIRIPMPLEKVLSLLTND